MDDLLPSFVDHKTHACRDYPPNVFFSDPPPIHWFDNPAEFRLATDEANANRRLAIAVCKLCPHADKCLAFALRNRMDFGVWGGKTTAQRRKLQCLTDSNAA